MRTAREARNVEVVVNAGCRRGAAALNRTAGMLEASGLGPVRTHPVRDGAELAATLDRVAADGPDLLVVGGGDGTVSCAAGRAAGTEVTLGVLPLGTANDFARTLEIPTPLPAVIAALVEGHVVDHGALDLADLLQVAVGNGRHYGGGNAVAPNASIDHLLDVHAIERGRLRDHVSLARSCGTAPSSSTTGWTTSRPAGSGSRPRALGVNLDGGVVASTPALFEVERNAVHVVVPRTSRAAVLDGARAEQQEGAP